MDILEVGSFVVAESQTAPRFWYMGDVVKIDGDILSVKIYDAYNDNMKGATLFFKTNEIEFVETNV